MPHFTSPKSSVSFAWVISTVFPYGSSLCLAMVSVPAFHDASSVVSASSILFHSVLDGSRVIFSLSHFFTSGISCVRMRCSFATSSYFTPDLTDNEKSSIISAVNLLAILLKLVYNFYNLAFLLIKSKKSLLFCRDLDHSMNYFSYATSHLTLLVGRISRRPTHPMTARAHAQRA